MAHYYKRWFVGGLYTMFQLLTGRSLKFGICPYRAPRLLPFFYDCFPMVIKKSLRAHFQNNNILHLFVRMNNV